MFTIKKGPTLLWSVTTVVQRTNERVAGITGSNPVVIEDFYHLAMFEVKVVTNVNLNLVAVRIHGSLTGTAASTTVGFPPLNSQNQALAAPILASSPLLVTGQATVVAAALVLASQTQGQSALTAFPPALLLEYDTAAPGATPNLVFEVRGTFFGQPFYQTIP